MTKFLLLITVAIGAVACDKPHTGIQQCDAYLTKVKALKLEEAQHVNVSFVLSTVGHSPDARTQEALASMCRDYIAQLDN